MSDGTPAHTQHCASCSKPVPEGGEFCSFCGTRLSSAKNQPAVTNSEPVHPPVATKVSATSASSGKAIISLIGLGVCLWFLYQSGFFGELISTVTGPARQSMYQSFDVGYWNYRVDKMITVAQLGKGSFAKKPDGRFVIVSLTVRNGDTTASMLPSATLRDEMGREHSSTVNFGSDLPGEDLTLVTLNPGVSKSGYFIFDVPTDAQGLQLIVSGGHNSGRKAIVPVY
jgi:Domain of unknown function (DUF4352)